MFWYTWNSLEGESGLCGPFDSRSKVEDSIADLIESLGDVTAACFFIEDDNMRPDLIDVDINQIVESVIR
ncbi:hypothetical protein N9045_01650 [bacterium]|nr:hypothetical protein [bacterium]